MSEPPSEPKAEDMNAYAERVLAECREWSWTKPRGENAIHEAGHVLAHEEEGVSWIRVFLPVDDPDLGGRVESHAQAVRRLPVTATASTL